MATTGIIAKVYQCPYIRARTIAANNVGSDDTYTDSNNGFVTAGFVDGDVVTVSGFTTSGNNGSKTIATVVAGTMTLSGATLTDEVAGDDVVIVKNAPGTLIAACKGVTATRTANMVDTTTFKDTIGATITANTIAFVEGGASKDTITDSGAGFVAAGFKAGDVIWITGSTDNNKTVTIYSVTTTTITILATDDLAAEIAGDDVTIRAINNWLKYTPTSKGWTASLDNLWTVTEDALFGVPRRYEFFDQYYASPSGGNPVYYLEGIGIANQIDTQINVLEVIKQPITITGIGSLTTKTKTTSW
ncbi:MAG: hypothetical protein QG588_16 [Candidatus Poribacteria bacterium]|nr:hypothetical protein [Candidatus Poribacteria bacterium]